MSETKLMPVMILDWRPMKRNSLLGFAKIQLGALKISDVTVNTNSGRLWAGLPSKPMIDRDGAAMRNDQGKIRYVPILEWDNKGTGDRFSDSVVSALEAAHPGATREQ